jgi:hypothetical protein
MDNVGIFYGHFVNFMAIRCRYSVVMWIFYGNLVNFSSFGMLHQENSGKPG